MYLQSEWRSCRKQTILDHVSLDLNPDRNEATSVCVQDSYSKKRLESIGIQTERNITDTYSFDLYVFSLSFAMFALHRVHNSFNTLKILLKIIMSNSLSQVIQPVY